MPCLRYSYILNPGAYFSFSVTMTRVVPDLFSRNSETELSDQPIKKKDLYKEKFFDEDFAQAARTRITREGEKEGIRFAWSDDAKLRNSSPCHRLLWKVYNTKGSDAQAKLCWKLYQVSVVIPKVLTERCVPQLTSFFLIGFERRGRRRRGPGGSVAVCRRRRRDEQGGRTCVH
jgi:hypothetical protein